MSKIRIISDIHGYIPKYHEIKKEADYSIQIGDLAFDFSFLDKINSEKHKFFPGNHCNHDTAYNYPHCLGRYGEFELNGVTGFFISGGFSIDYMYRIKHQMATGKQSWWKQEQLDADEIEDCFQLYTKVKPDFVLSHETPTIVARRIGNPNILREFGFEPVGFTTNTQELLQNLWNFHEPKLWIYGHFHLKSDMQIRDTRFICLPEFGYCFVDSNLEVTGLS